MRELHHLRLMIPVSLLALVFLLLLLPRTRAVAALESVAEMFRKGDYEQARSNLRQGGEAIRPAEDTLWQSRMSQTPDEAIAELNVSLEQATLPPEVSMRAALEIAELEFARGRYVQALTVLTPLVQQETGNLPGEVYLRAGLCLRALGNQQKAREMLASIRPSDPTFNLARYYLGDIGLDQRDPVLALHYFEAAVENTSDEEFSRMAAGLWKALRDTDRNDQAQALLERLQRQTPGCLALLEINHVLRLELEDRSVRESQVLADTTAAVETVTTPTAGRYSIQLGAFSDRRLALDFLRRFSTDLSDLHIDQVTDVRGQFLYKVRCSSFVNPALARAEAQRISRRLNVPTLVVDTTE